MICTANGLQLSVRQILHKNEISSLLEELDELSDSPANRHLPF